MVLPIRPGNVSNEAMGMENMTEMANVTTYVYTKLRNDPDYIMWEKHQ